MEIQIPNRAFYICQYPDEDGEWYKEKRLCFCCAVKKALSIHTPSHNNKIVVCLYDEKSTELFECEECGILI